MHRHTRSLVLSCLILCALLTACGVKGTKIELNNFSPSFTEDMSDYKGKRAYLPWVINQDNGTTLHYYYSPDGNFSYGSQYATDEYFWYSFASSLRRAGVWVSDPNKPEKTAPSILITLKSISDVKFFVEVKMEKASRIVFIKNYTVTEEELKQQDRTPANLEKRAYNMTNKLNQMILTDPEFKNAFFKASA
jgi:hypothetical protein